jgi:hypothetical protein
MAHVPVLGRFWQTVGLWLLVSAPLLLVASLMVYPGWPDWLPCGDDGNVELFTWYVLHDVQLGGIRTHGNLAEHPGPTYFYLLAPLYGLFGCAYKGLRLGAMLINFGAIGCLLGVARRHGGRQACLGFALLTAAYIRFMTVPWLASVWPPFVVILSFLAALILFSATAMGRPYCLAPAAALASFVVQTQLGCAPVLTTLAVASLLLLVLPRLRTWLGAGCPTAGSVPRALLLTAAILIPLWTPTAVKQFMGMPGRLSETVRYFASQGVGQDWQHTLGTLEQTLAAFPASLLGVDTRGAVAAWEWPARAQAHALLVRILALAQVALLPLAYLMARRRFQPFNAILCLFAALSLLAMVFSVRHIAGDILFHQVFWMTALGLVNLYVIGNALFLEFGRWLRFERGPKRQTAAIVLTAAAVALLSAGNAHNAVRDLPLIRYEAADPLLEDGADEPLLGGDERNARQFVARARCWLQTNHVSRYRLRILGLHHCGVATGTILGLTKAGLRPELDPWYARIFAPQYPRPSAAVDGALLLCDRSSGQQLEQRPELRVVVRGRYATLFWIAGD